MNLWKFNILVTVFFWDGIIFCFCYITFECFVFLQGYKLKKTEIAKKQYFERQLLNEDGGYQDQLTCTQQIFVI